MCAERDSNPRRNNFSYRIKSPVQQPALPPAHILYNYFKDLYLQPRKDSNLRPLLLESNILSTELHGY